MENRESRPGTLTVAFLLFIAVLLPLLVAAFLVFNLQGPPPASGGSTGTASATQSAVTITIPKGVGSNLSVNFEPAKIKVVVGVNNTIEWVENDPIPHTVTSLSVPPGSEAFDSKTLNEGQAFSVTLTVPGTYEYDCTFHPGWMKGTITVLAQGSTTQASGVSESGNKTNVILPNGVGSNSNLNFHPADITVIVGVNNTIQWTDQDSVPHTVTSTSVPSGAKSFNSGNMKEGDVFSVTLTVPGNYEYVCNYHLGWMKGTIIVKPAPTG